MPTELSLLDAQHETPSPMLRLGAALDELVDDGHLPAEGSDAGDQRRIPVARTWLWLLGYLQNDNEKERFDSALQEALAAFRVEAGLPPAAAMDERTWRRLQSLVSFDALPDVGALLDPSFNAGLLRRVVQLRLFSYGLITKQPSHVPANGSKAARLDRDFQRALDDFVRVAVLLDLYPQPLEPGLNRELLSLLFAHDTLVRRLRTDADSFAMRTQQHPALPFDKNAARDLVKTFIANVAVVELWLLGYDVRPGNFREGAAGAREGDDSLFGAMDKFAADRGLKGVKQHAVMVGTWFFREACLMQDEQHGPHELDDATVDYVLADTSRMRDLRDEYRSVGARIVDGIKRALSWLKNFFRKVGGAVKQLLRNVARVLHKVAAGVHGRLSGIVEVMRMGCGYFFCSPVMGSSMDCVYVCKGADFDMDVLINPRALEGAISGFFDSLGLRIRAMQLGGRIIGQLWSLVHLVIRTAGAALSWLGLLFVLVKLGRWLKDSVALSAEVEELLSNKELRSVALAR